MDWLNKLQLESAARNIVDSLEILRRITGAFAITGDMADGEIDIAVQVREEDYDRLTAGKISCVQKMQFVEDYPWKKYVVIGGVKFFTLMKELKEAV